MTRFALADLRKVLTPHVPLCKSRLEALCLLVLGMISARTVNLTHIAVERPSRAKVASTYRRLQRFFQQVILPEDWSVGIVMALIGNPDRWYLCLDSLWPVTRRPSSWAQNAPRGKSTGAVQSRGSGPVSTSSAAVSELTRAHQSSEGN